jgi:hypothetical protein
LLSERGYWDEWNHWHAGYYLPIGTVSEVSGEEPAERKRREAIGNGGQLPSVAHDAIGGLPQLRIQWGQ